VCASTHLMRDMIFPFCMMRMLEKRGTQHARSQLDATSGEERSVLLDHPLSSAFGASIQCAHQISAHRSGWVHSGPTASYVSPNRPCPRFRLFRLQRHQRTRGEAMDARAPCLTAHRRQPRRRLDFTTAASLCGSHRDFARPEHQQMGRRDGSAPLLWVLRSGRGVCKRE
jgi:hypothetical protein